MGFFFSSKPKVSKFEFKKVRSSLSARGWSRFDLDRLEGLFQGHLQESGSASGIDRKEVDNLLSWLKTNRPKHTISEIQITELEDVLNKYL